MRFVIFLILFSSCGRIDTSGKQTVDVQIPDSKQTIVLEQDVSKLFDFFYRACYVNIYKESATFMDPNVVYPDADECAYNTMSEYMLNLPDELDQ